VPIAVRAGSLDAASFPGDPADRLIYATAVEHAARVVSADDRLRAVDPDRVIW
jgi:PIN domain nuclease of toxin-antitoxin system